MTVSLAADSMQMLWDKLEHTHTRACACVCVCVCIISILVILVVNANKCFVHLIKILQLQTNFQIWVYVGCQNDLRFVLG